MPRNSPAPPRSSARSSKGRQGSRAASSRAASSRAASRAPSSPIRLRRALVLALLALAAWAAPISPATVAHLYSERFYATLQPIVTSISGLAPFAVLDVLLAAALTWVGIRSAGIVRLAGPARRSALGALVADGIALVSLLYLVFLLLWGLNYRRPPIEARLDFSSRRVNAAAIDALAHRAVDELNQLHDPAHADPSATATWSAVRVRLAPAFAAAQRDLAASALTTAGRPKWSLLSLYFRWAGIDGMVNPFGLEVIVNPDVTPMERPFVVAHEWGHLAGWARESEASFVGWVTCLEGDATARYSAWLSLYWRLRGDVPRDTLATLDGALTPGVRQDLRAIRDRLLRGAPTLERASWQVYDRFLKANRVPEGLRSYDEVVTLIAGTATDADGRPRLNTKVTKH